MLLSWKSCLRIMAWQNMAVVQHRLIWRYSCNWLPAAYTLRLLGSLSLLVVCSGEVVPVCLCCFCFGSALFAMAFGVWQLHEDDSHLHEDMMDVRMDHEVCAWGCLHQAPPTMVEHQCPLGLPYLAPSYCFPSCHCLSLSSRHETLIALMTNI